MTEERQGRTSWRRHPNGTVVYLVIVGDDGARNAGAVRYFWPHR